MDKGISMNKPTKKEIEDKMLEGLNDFMKDYGIKAITFGKTHKIKKMKGKKAKSVVVKKRKTS